MYQVIVLENGAEKPISEWPSKAGAIFEQTVLIAHGFEAWVKPIVNQVSALNNRNDL